MAEKNYILAQDPGSVIHGLAVVDPVSMRILAHGLNPHTITMMKKGVHEQVVAYQNLLEALKGTGCEYAVAERFQTRGIKGLSSEVVSGMLFVTMLTFPGKTRFLIASQWKQAYTRAGLDLDAFYVEMRPITPHQIDASLMGLFMACKIRRVPLLGKGVLRKLLLAADQPSVEQRRESVRNKVRPVTPKTIRRDKARAKARLRKDKERELAKVARAAKKESERLAKVAARKPKKVMASQ